MEDEKAIERIISSSIGIGVIQTLKELGLIDEYMTESQAYKLYTKKLVTEWRHKRWIIGYPSGNSTRAKYHFKRSELETASRMLDIYNIVTPAVWKRIPDQILEDKAWLKGVQKRQ